MTKPTYLEWLKQCHKNWLDVYGTDEIIPASPPICGKDTKRIDKILKKLEAEIIKEEPK